MAARDGFLCRTATRSWPFGAEFREEFLFLSQVGVRRWGAGSGIRRSEQNTGTKAESGTGTVPRSHPPSRARSPPSARSSRLRFFHRLGQRERTPPCPALERRQAGGTNHRRRRSAFQL